MSLEEAMKKHNFKHISVSKWRHPSQSVHPARGGPRSPTISPSAAAKPFVPTYKVSYRKLPEPTDDEESDQEEKPSAEVEAPLDSPMEVAAPASHSPAPDSDSAPDIEPGSVAAVSVPDASEGRETEAVTEVGDQGERAPELSPDPQQGGDVGSEEGLPPPPTQPDVSAPEEPSESLADPTAAENPPEDVVEEAAKSSEKKTRKKSERILVDTDDLLVNLPSPPPTEAAGLGINIPASPSREHVEATTDLVSAEQPEPNGVVEVASSADTLRENQQLPSESPAHEAEDIVLQTGDGSENTVPSEAAIPALEQSSTGTDTTEIEEEEPKEDPPTAAASIIEATEDVKSVTVNVASPTDEQHSDYSEKRVSFAPGTPEPRPTVRKKKAATDSKKKRKNTVASPNQDVPADTEDTIHGPSEVAPPFEPSADVPEEVKMRSAEESSEDKAELALAESAGVPEAAPIANATETPGADVPPTEEVIESNSEQAESTEDAEAADDHAEAGESVPVSANSDPLTPILDNAANQSAQINIGTLAAPVSQSDDPADPGKKEKEKLEIKQAEDPPADIADLDIEDVLANAPPPPTKALTDPPLEEEIVEHEMVKPADEAIEPPSETATGDAPDPPDKGAGGGETAEVPSLTDDGRGKDHQPSQELRDEAREHVAELSDMGDETPAEPAIEDELPSAEGVEAILDQGDGQKPNTDVETEVEHTPQPAEEESKPDESGAVLLDEPGPAEEPGEETESQADTREPQMVPADHLEATADLHPDELPAADPPGASPQDEEPVTDSHEEVPRSAPEPVQENIGDAVEEALLDSTPLDSDNVEAPAVTEEPVKDVTVETAQPMELAPDPAPDPAPDSASELAPESASEPAPEPVSEPAPDPAPDPAPQPAPEPASEPVSEPAPQPAPEPVSEPAPAPSAPPSPTQSKSSYKHKHVADHWERPAKHHVPSGTRAPESPKSRKRSSRRDPEQSKGIERPHRPRRSSITAEEEAGRRSRKDAKRAEEAARALEEEAGRRSRKDAKRAEEAARALEEERQRMHEEELRRIRDEARRAARKAATEEAARLVREEAEAVAREEAEAVAREEAETKRRRRERRQQESEREYRDVERTRHQPTVSRPGLSKAFTVTAGESVTRAGLFVRTSSNTARHSRDVPAKHYDPDHGSHPAQPSGEASQDAPTSVPGSQAPGSPSSTRSNHRHRHRRRHSSNAESEQPERAVHTKDRTRSRRDSGQPSKRPALEQQRTISFFGLLRKVIL